MFFEFKLKGGFFDMKEEKVSEEKKKSHKVLKVVLWILFWPLMLVITIVSSKKFKLWMKILLLAVLFLISLLLSNFTASKKTEGDTTVQTVEKIDKYADLTQLAPVDDLDIKEDFVYAADLIGIDIANVRNVEKLDEGIYSFTYLDTYFEIVGDEELLSVAAVRNAAGTEVYKRDYVPYNVNDYIVKADKIKAVKDECVKILGEKLGEETVLGDVILSADYDVYSVIGSTEDKAHSFNIAWDTVNKKAVKFVMDDEVIVEGNVSADDEREKYVNTVISGPDLKDKNEIEYKEVVLKYGETGNYGEKYMRNGSEVILYSFPEGRYELKNKVNFCRILIVSDEEVENADGVVENEILQTLEFTGYGQKMEVELTENSHIELTVNAKIEVTQLND